MRLLVMLAATLVSGILVLPTVSLTASVATSYIA